MRPARRHLAPIVALALAGCSLLGGPNVPPTRFYVLSPDAVGAPRPSDLAVGLGPVRFPGYLDRPEMAVRRDANHIAYLDTARWAEPLKDNFVRVLGTDLGQRLGTDRIIPFPWYRNVEPPYSVSVDVLRFEAQAGKMAALQARWTLRDKAGAPLAANTLDASRPAADPDAVAAALSAMTAELAQQIADAVAHDARP